MTFNQNLFELASEQINSALQKMLDTDPANKVFIAKLEGVKIKIESTQPAYTFLMSFLDGAICFQQAEDEKNTEAKNADETDLQLKGTAINLIKLVMTPIENASALRNSNVSVSGDIGLLLELSQVAKMIDIDWELLLADRIGEAPAVVISRAISSGLREAKKLHSDLFEKLTEKMQSEDSLFPIKTNLTN